jgi:hypothetical protein
MLLRSTLFAIILLGTLTLLNDAHATAVLPDCAPIALDEQATSIFRVRVRQVGEGLVQRRAWVFLGSTDTSCDLLFIYGFLAIINYGVIVFGGASVFVEKLGTLAAARGLAEVFGR